MFAALWPGWSRYSFRKQLFIILTLLTAALTAIFTFLLITYERHSHTEKLRNEGEILSSILKKELQIPLYAGYNDEVSKRASAMLRYPSISAITVINASGIIVADVHAKGDAGSDEKITLLSDITTEESGFAPEELLLGEHRRHGGKIGSIQLKLNTYSVANRMNYFIKVAVVCGLLFWILISTIGYLIIKEMHSTLETLFSAVESIAAGNLATRIAVSSSSDSRRAAEAINSMAATLQQREEENRALQLEKVNRLRLEFDAEKKQYMAKLIQTNRMTSLGLLVAGMAHEINNPNGTIKLAGESLEKAWRDIEKLLAGLARDEGDFSIAGMPFSSARDEITCTLGNLSRSSDRINRVVQNLRSYSLGNRCEAKKNVDINRVVSGALAIVQAYSLRTDINISTVYARDIPVISGNPFQLEQVFTNLLMNAVQSLPAKGSRRVQLTTGFSGCDKTVTVAVRDEGHGIDAQNIPHLCEPFFSTRINDGGSGLGLYISNFIVSEHHGRMEFDSKPGEGCTVTVYLPVG